ncbi:hypothetical protein HLB23_14055 [Nocardia uniformis]|uniref:Mce-associated membrane protein n=1 Tax=Nocardia uniformis TaxID=53432 RepID=A0A849BWN6_9NOCA|nr:hypothetical protein [Nocardia uniformis]NNH70972.1 hypothetical protein [Nocardia uniformis]
MKSRWKDWNDKGIRIPLLGVGALLLLAVTVLGALGYRGWDLSDRNADLAGSLADYRRKAADCTAAIQAGTSFLMAANNFDYRKPEEWTQLMAAQSTGPIHDYFANPKVQQDNTELIKAGKLRKTSTVADAACAVQADAGIRVVAHIDESTQNFQTPDPVVTTSAVWVELAAADGTWKAVDSGRGDQALRGGVAAVQPPGPDTTTAPAQPR